MAASTDKSLRQECIKTLEGLLILLDMQNELIRSSLARLRKAAEKKGKKRPFHREFD